jgi:hypothetical protein
MEAMMPVGLSLYANDLQKKSVIFMKFLASMPRPARGRDAAGTDGGAAAAPPLAGPAR